jgi:hypothetical protein
MLAEIHPGMVLANVAASTRKSIKACWPPFGMVKALI